MNFLTVILTAVAVSIDSFVVGFGVSLNKRNTTLLPSAVAFATLILCLATSLIGKSLQTLLQQKANLLGACLLFCLGLLNLAKREDFATLNNLSLKQSLAAGFTVGLDGAIANLSLVSTCFTLLPPLIITVAHFLAVLAGQQMAQKTRLEGANKLSALTLVTLAICKLI